MTIQIVSQQVQKIDGREEQNVRQETDTTPRDEVGSRNNSLKRVNLKLDEIIKADLERMSHELTQNPRAATQEENLLESRDSPIRMELGAAGDVKTEIASNSLQHPSK